MGPHWDDHDTDDGTTLISHTDPALDTYTFARALQDEASRLIELANGIDDTIEQLICELETGRDLYTTLSGTAAAGFEELASRAEAVTAHLPIVLDHARTLIGFYGLADELPPDDHPARGKPSPGSA